MILGKLQSIRSRLFSYFFPPESATTAGMQTLEISFRGLVVSVGQVCVEICKGLLTLGIVGWCLPEATLPKIEEA